MNMDTHLVSPVEESGEDFASLFEAQEAANIRLQPGQKVTATVIAITGDNVFLDVGVKVDGIMERKDILDVEGNESVSVGDTVEAWVTAVAAHEIRISRSMSGSGMAAIEDAWNAALPVEGKVSATCKGGYVVDLMGKRAFCPGSQMDIAQTDAESLVGRTLPFLITKVESGGRNIVVSRRALQERERRENLEKLLENIHEGDVVSGSITRLAPFGAFMEIAPSVEGMIHLSELSWSRIEKAEDIVNPGDAVQAKILGITTDAKGNTRISLSRKQAESDPWAQAGDSLKPGDVVSGKVTRLTSFGAFIEILPGIEGLVHLSEMSWTKRVSKASEILHAGEHVSVKIKEISLEKRRVSLSLRDAEGDPWSDVAQTYPVGSTVTGTVEGNTNFGIFVTLQPGVTALLPLAVIKASKKQELAKLDKGQSVTLLVQNVDTAARRISLAPEGFDAPAKKEDTAWAEHARSGQSQGGLGIMAQALQKAIKNKQ